MNRSAAAAVRCFRGPGGPIHANHAVDQMHASRHVRRQAEIVRHRDHGLAVALRQIPAGGRLADEWAIVLLCRLRASARSIGLGAFRSRR